MRLQEKLHPMFPSPPFPVTCVFFFLLCVIPWRNFREVNKPKYACKHTFLHLLLCWGMLWILASAANFIKSFRIAFGPVAGSCACVMWFGDVWKTFLPILCECNEASFYVPVMLVFNSTHKKEQSWHFFSQFSEGWGWDVLLTSGGSGSDPCPYSTL